MHFFVNVELLNRPELRGRSVIVARNSPRSVVTSASYEARQFGVRSAMPLVQALRLCPQAVVIEPTSNYRHYSQGMMEVLRQITDQVEQISIDEAFVDLTPALRCQGDPVQIAQKARQEIAGQLGLPSSVGISSSKCIAKMASSASKPNGLWLIPPGRIQEFLDPLPVDKLWGVGAKTAGHLHDLGIQTVQELRVYELGWLQRRFGRATGLHLYNMARGLDRRKIQSHRAEKSIGAERTFDQDQQEASILTTELYSLCLTVAQRLRLVGKQSRRLSLKIRYSSFQTLTRSCPLPAATQSGRKMFDAVIAYLVRSGLLTAGGDFLQPIRLLGVRAEKLEDLGSGVQLTLFDSDSAVAGSVCHQHWEDVERAMDTIQAKFGGKGLLPARLLRSGR